MTPHHLHEDIPGGVPLKMWTRGVPVEDEARRQLTNAARLPVVYPHIAAYVFTGYPQPSAARSPQSPAST